MAKVLFPGSFNPFTAGHEHIVRRALRVFDGVVVAVGVNPEKHYEVPAAERVARIEAIFSHEPRVSVCSYTDNTVDLCRRLGIGVMVRGLRNGADLEYEKEILRVNHELDPAVETLFIVASDAMAGISSTAARGENNRIPRT